MLYSLQIPLGNSLWMSVSRTWSGCVVYSFAEQSCPVKTICSVISEYPHSPMGLVGICVGYIYAEKCNDETPFYLPPLSCFHFWSWSFRRGGRLLSEELLYHHCSWYSSNSGRDSVKINVCILKCLLRGFSAAVVLLPFSIILHRLSCLL